MPATTDTHQAPMTGSAAPRAGGGRRPALLVTSVPGQLPVTELERLAALGERPRKDYVELARALGAVVVDREHMRLRAHPAARALARRAGLPAGQVAEAFVNRRRYSTILAWADRLGLPLAALYKATGTRADLVLVSVWLSRGRKAMFLERGNVQTHLRAIVCYASVQAAIARDRLGVPAEKLHVALQPVDDRFWAPATRPDSSEAVICSVGWEARDYATLVDACTGLDVTLDLATGSIALSAEKGAVSASPRFRSMVTAGLPAWVRTGQYDPRGLRNLYARSRFVVIPTMDVDFDAGVTAIAEAMAMGRAVITTRTRGQVDLVRHGETGLYVPPNDPAALRAAITTLLSDPALADRMGRAGRVVAEQELALDRYVDRLAALVRAGSAAGPGGTQQ